ncbi:lipopolysaccharide heptosyltransferase I [Wielerella bovis]|uniref:lipopolysaccharide heptosyltransferase I n=1 Tax=Wielerella bovis TaxID=2917790 RepID=UPI0020187B3A|nr:lipopolysaccharide heptosyltransferase I [Wielerella bovis]ULJ64857.1 lipopolysaccharide heptosyltransferase I [Wielerella bovis]ULJ67130.1 lipopolysaccharide heptosyltransferase I [Wielerella bovis]
MKILLVRLSSMGDLIHTLPAVSDLAQHRPDVELHWLCETSFADIARLHPFVKRVHTMSWRKWRKNLFQAATWQEIGSLKTALRNENYTQVLDSQGLIKSAAFAKFAHAPIIGLDSQSARESFAAHFYQQTYAVKKGEDAIWRNRQLFAQAFDYTFETIPNFGVILPPDAIGSLKNQLPEKYYIVLHATSRDSKLWVMEKWLDLLTKLHQTDGLPVLLPWGNPTEKQRAEAIASKLPFAQVCPRVNLLEAAYMLANAHAVIGVDTGLLHLANAVNRPLVGIYTDSDPVKTGVQPSAWAQNLGGIGQSPSADEVFQAVQGCLKAFAKPI